MHIRLICRSLRQVNQQMAGMNFYGTNAPAGAAAGPPGVQQAGEPATSSTAHMAAHVWK